MNITEKHLREFIELFHETLQKTAEQFLAPEHVKALLHLSLLPARIIGYVSTQFGVAIEYIPSAKTEIQILKGSARIEDLLLQAPSPARKIGPMFIVAERPSDTANPIDMYYFKVSGAFPFRLAGPNSRLRLGDMEFEIGGWQRHIEFAEVFGNRSMAFWSSDHAVARAKDEVIAALVQTQRAQQQNLSLPEYITSLKSAPCCF